MNQNMRRARRTRTVENSPHFVVSAFVVESYKRVIVTNFGFYSHDLGLFSFLAPDECAIYIYIYIHPLWFFTQIDDTMVATPSVSGTHPFHPPLSPFRFFVFAAGDDDGRSRVLAFSSLGELTRHQVWAWHLLSWLMLAAAFVIFWCQGCCFCCCWRWRLRCVLVLVVVETSIGSGDTQQQHPTIQFLSPHRVGVILRA